MPLLLPEAPQLDLGSYFYPGTRKTYLVPEYVYFSNDHQSPLLSRLLRMDFIFYFLCSFLFYFSFYFHFLFPFLEQLGLGFISHAVTSVTN